MPRRRQIAASQARGLPGPTSPGTRIIGPRRASRANCIATAFTGEVLIKERPRNLSALLFSSFRDGALAPDLRCAIAHRGISRFSGAQLRTIVRVFRRAPE